MSTGSYNTDTKLQNGNADSVLKRPYFWIALATGLVGIAISIATTVILYNQETSQIQYQFEIDINKRSFELQKEMGLHFETLHRWKSFYETYKELPFDKFQKLASDVLKRHKGITALAWAPRVPLEARAQFEEGLKALDPRLIGILDLPDVTQGFSKETTLRVAGKRDDYYPVTMIAPIESSNFIVGLDISGDPLRRRNFNQARDSGKIQATEVFPSFFDEKGSPEFAAFAPVYGEDVLLEEQRREVIQGFITASFKLDVLIDRSGFAVNLEGVHLTLLDKKSFEGLKELYVHTPRSNVLEELSIEVSMEPLAGQQWSIHAAPTTQYMNAKRTPFPYVVGFLGLITVTLAIICIRIIDRRTRVIENTVTERTKALNEAKDKLERLSRTDGLTGVANRRFFDEFIEKEWRACKREGGTISLIMLDVDYFKKFNDHYGHVEGDSCLQAVAKAIKDSASRASDLVARYGGEEFAVVVKGGSEEVAVLAEKIKNNVAALDIKHELSQVSDRVSVSIGVVTAAPEKTSEIEVLIRVADEALYEAKAAGRDQIVIGKFPPA